MKTIDSHQNTAVWIIICHGQKNQGNVQRKIINSRILV